MDCREKLTNDVRNALTTRLSSEDAAYVLDVLIVKLSEYEITERCTEIATVDSADDIIIKNYVGCIIVEGKSNRTAKQYAYSIKRLRSDSGKTIAEIKTQDIRVWLANLKLKGRKNAYLGSQRNNLNAFFKWAKEEGYIEENPCEPIKPIKKPYVKRKPFSDEDIDALRSACEDSLDRSLIEFLLSSGVRVQECCDMLISDIDFSKKTVMVRHGKGDKERETYISPVAKKYLILYLKERKVQSPSLFVGKRGTYAPVGIQKRLRAIAKRANVGNVHPHRFRRTLATTLAKRGMPIQEIQRILGHASISTTQGYIDTDNTTVEASYRKYVA